MTKCDCAPTSICACCAECPMGQADRRRQMTSMTSLTTLQRSCRHILTCQPSDESRSQLAMPSGIPCPDASSQETVQTPGTWSDVFDIHEVCATFSPITYVRHFALLQVPATVCHTRAICPAGRPPISALPPLREIDCPCQRLHIRGVTGDRMFDFK